MSTILAIGEVGGGRPTRLTLELATLSAQLATDLGSDVSVLLAGDDLGAAADEVAAHGPAVLVSPGVAAASPAGATLAAALTAIETLGPGLILIGASPEGRDLAGMLVGLTDLAILVAGDGVTIAGGAVSVEMAAWGGRLVSRSRFGGESGIVLVRPGAIAPVHAERPGAVRPLAGELRAELPEVTLVEQVVAEAARASIDDARIVIGAGRGVAGPEGVRLVETLADALDGAVGATRAAVDSGWIDFSQQIGQTGKTVKPELYIACGVSGAIQHKVGIQAAGTIVAINKDPDAPIAEFADLLVVGDLFEIVPLLIEALHEARGSTS